MEKIVSLKRNVWLLYGISLLQGMVFYGPVATLYRRAAGVSIFQITMIESISLALCIALEMPWGVIADRIGYRRTMIINCLIYVVSKIVFWRADGFGDFLMERVMLSVVMAGLSGCDVSILYLSCRKGESHRVFGIYNMFNTAGLLFAALIFSAAVGDDYRLAGFLTVVTYSAAAVLAFGIKEVKEGREKGKNDRSKETGNVKKGFIEQFFDVIRDRRFLLLLVGMAFLAETRQTIAVFLSQLQYERCGISSVNMGYIYILVTVAGMAGIWSAKITGKLGEKGCALTLFGAATVSCLILAFTENAFLSIFGIMALSISASLFVPLQVELQNRHVKSSNRATVLSIYAVITESIGIFTNLLFGRAASAALPLAMVCGAVLCALGAGFFMAWYWHIHF